MENVTSLEPRRFDRINAYLAGAVGLVSFIIYALTVQQSVSFWDCGEFIAAASILGVPHPPGTPLLIMISRIFALIPFVEDISHRINYVSVISSSLTAVFSYLLAVRMIRTFFAASSGSARLLTYAGGVAAGFFVAFSATNWGNSVEAEAYGLALALSTALIWLTLIYHERRTEPGASRLMVLAIYLAVLGIGIHMTVFLVVPVCAIFFILDHKSGKREYAILSLFGILELILIFLFASAQTSPTLFKVISVVLGLVLLVMLHRRIRWGILIALAAVGTIMVSFSLFIWAVPIGAVVLVLLGLASKTTGLKIQWKTALMILLAGYIGFSVHFFLPIRSSLNPRIDENNASRGWPGDWTQFKYFLDRKQYGQTSMVDRMFQRRGTWSNQFGRHAHMGFWSFFEEQYGGRGGPAFTPFLLLGLIGLIVAIRKRLELGLPFLTLLLLCSAGLVLYMNFADGTLYNQSTGDAYLEVRNRDYFFTPAFVFFGIAMGMGVAGAGRLVKDFLGKSPLARPLVYGCSALALLPVVTLASNYYSCDRSNNILPYVYAENILRTCDNDALLFTGGDNDTFPIWCLQEAYGYRRDIRVVNLSLLNTDWYIEQMKNRYNVPISLTDEQIIWLPFELPGGIMTNRPARDFNDRPRGRRTYLHPQFSGIATQHMMVDEIVIENQWRYPMYFSGMPYAESPLNLRKYTVSYGNLFKLERTPDSSLVDVDNSYNLYMNVYRFDGMESAQVYRDDNATGVWTGMAMGSLGVFDELMRRGDRDRAEALMYHMIEVMPEFWQAYASLADLYELEGDSARALGLYEQLHTTLEEFHRIDPTSQAYMMDLGTAKVMVGLRTGDDDLIADGVDLSKRGFAFNRSDGLALRKLIAGLREAGEQYTYDIILATQQHAEYKRNLQDPLVMSILGLRP